MLGNRKTFRAQSAMEYLMTYGWAILIIAVVLGALFSLGVFSGSSLLGTSCVASPGYLCSSPVLSTTGALSITFGQNTGSSIYNVELACTATTNSLGLPANAYAFYGIAAGTGGGPWAIAGNVVPPGMGGGNAITGTNAVALASGQTISIGTATGSQGLPCYGTTGVAFGPAGSSTSTATPVAGVAPAAIGTTFSGFIILNYTTTTCTATPCTWYTVRAATVTVKVV